MRRSYLRKAWNIIYILLVAATIVLTAISHFSEKARLEQGIAETDDIQYKLPYAFLLPFTAIFLTVVLAVETSVYLSVRYFLKDRCHKTSGKTAFYAILLCLTLIIIGSTLSKIISVN